MVTLACAALGTQALPGDSSQAAARTLSSGTTAVFAGGRTITYQGITLTVPGHWPVYRLADDPTRCVRFDQEAVYLGAPGQNQNCPARVLGQAAAVLVQPLDASGVTQAMTLLKPAVVDGQAVAVAPRNAVQPAYKMVSPRAHAEVVVTSGTNSAVARAITTSIRIAAAPARPAPLGSAGPAGVPPVPGITAGASVNAGTAGGPSLYTGQAFDACAAPSSATMTAWGSSPYRGIGVYLGGDEAACAQPNLTSAWLTGVAVAGWHLIPIYVGPQAACTGVSFSHVIDAANATQEGGLSAQAAVSIAAGLGLGVGNPIYYDMESWNNADTACNTAVLAYLNGWTTELHTLGYKSGVYSSAATGITALVDVVGKPGYVEPDELWFADWNGAGTTSDPYVPASDWISHQRIHQYSGGTNQTYGGATLNIDGDYADALLGGPGSGSGSGSFPTFGNTSADVTLAAGRTLTPGTTLVTPSRQYHLDMQRSDGNLVLYTASGRALWDTRTFGNPGAYAVMQKFDGNFVVYSAAGKALWSSHTFGNPGAMLALQTDANLVMYGSGGKALWWTGTANPRLTSGEELNGSWYLESPSRAFKLVEQKSDGNLVLYSFTGRAMWASGTWGHPGAHAVLQAAGNLTVYSATGQVLWNVGTSGDTGSRLVLQSDGNLVFYAAKGSVLWASGTT